MSQHRHRHKYTYNNYRSDKRTYYNQDTGVTLRGLTVKVWNNDINKALRKLKKLVQNDGKLQLIKDRQYYIKPSAIRKRAKDVARKRHLASQLTENKKHGRGRQSRDRCGRG